MENYIMVNGTKINLTEDQIRAIVEAYEPASKKMRLGDIPAGSSFCIGDTEFIVLQQCGEETEVITKNVMKNMAFGDTNNFDGSKVDAYCQGLGVEIGRQIGEDNLIPHIVDLTSDDGLKDYGFIERKVSLLTADQYRDHVEILDQHKPDQWWWLATPFSTKRHNEETWVKCVSPAGFINYGYYICDNSGVRPFCIFKSSIFVSSES